ncbi:hypothetical protein N332_12147, partial [Mesitornis unicolor]
TAEETSQPIEEMSGLRRRLKTPRENDSKVDYTGVKELFDTAEEAKVGSVNGMDSNQEDTAPRSSHKYEWGGKEDDRGNTSRGEDSQQKESAHEEQSTQRPTRGRPREAVQPASAKQREKDWNLKELRGLGKKSTREEVEELSAASSVAKSRGRRANRGIHQGIVSELPSQETVETVSAVEPHGATQRPRQGKRKAQELEQPSESLEPCSRVSSVLQNKRADTKRALQECGVSDTL